MRFSASLAIALVLIVVAGCDGGVYVRDGVTDGDTFYLAEYAYYDDDPVLQSWVAYSLDLSACQLMLGGDNPAHNSSFECEYGARLALADTWHEHTSEDPEHTNAYLDDLLAIREAGFLREYVADGYARRGWELPEDLAIAEYDRWRDDYLKGHRHERRIIGSWNYR